MEDIIGDAKLQELNIIFNFDQDKEGKLIVNAIIGPDCYKLELNPSPHLNVKQLKRALLQKEFRISQKSAQIMRLNVGINEFEFKSVQKDTLESLRSEIEDLKHRLKAQQDKNNILSDTVHRMKIESDQMSTKMRGFQQNLIQLKSEKELIVNPEKQQNINKPEKKQKPQQDEKVYKRHFSPYTKEETINLSNTREKAINNGPKIQNHFPLALISGQIKKGSSIRYQIEKIGVYIFLGFGLKNIIQSNKYLIKPLKYNDRGLFMMGCQGKTFCYSAKKLGEKQINFTNFKFEKGDIVQIRVEQTEVVFSNETKNQEYSMKIQLNESQWENAQFCVELEGEGDSVSVLGN